MARILSKYIAEEKWIEVKKELENGNKVSIPIITESNSFEFEPNLRGLKGKKSEKKDSPILDDKRSRIEKSGGSICPYSCTGTKVTKEGGDIDHIIPRSSHWGTLNDEANLILSCKDCNQNRKKGNEYLLKDLNAKYKKSLFDGKDDNEIERWIIAQIGDGSGEKFDFGNYKSFINLSQDERKAFRHALFLDQSHPLRKMVIKAIDNKNRAFVNGTQRYFAEVLANTLYKKAKAIDREGSLSFDYFCVETSSSNGRGVSDLREHYEKFDGEVKDHKKNKGQTQKTHSHLIDAEMAFVLMVDTHRNEGSMRLKIDKKVDAFPYSTETGEIYKENLFDSIKTKVCEKPRDLEAEGGDKKIVEIEKGSRARINLEKTFSRAIFTQNPIGEKYRPIFKHGESFYIGYPQKQKGGGYCLENYCDEMKGKEKETVKKIIQDQKYYQLKIDEPKMKLYAIKKVDGKYRQIDHDSHRYFSDLEKTYNEEELLDVKQIEFILKRCRYYVKKEEIINAPKVLKNSKNKRYPLYRNWENLDTEWKKEVGDCYSVKNEQYDFSGNEEMIRKWEKFIRRQIPRGDSMVLPSHAKKVRRYSMNAIGTPSGTSFRIKRHGTNTYQMTPTDTNQVGKGRSGFLVERSKNLTTAAKTPVQALKKDLIKELDTEKFEHQSEEVEIYNFFKEDAITEAYKAYDKMINKKPRSTEELKEDLKKFGIKVFLETTKAQVKNFPYVLFECFYILEKEKEDGEKKGGEEGLKGKKIEILTSKKLKDNNRKREKSYINKSELDKLLNLKPRSDQDLKITGFLDKEQKIDFTISFDSKKVKEFCKKIKTNGDS